jgi:hypothetical protein
VPHRGRVDHAGIVRHAFAAGQEVVPDPTELSSVHLGTFKAGTRPMKLHAAIA